jgi:hypothetical protein
MSPALGAQWLHQPTAGIARTPDGKADMTAAVPRAVDGHPDLSSLWQMRPGSYVVNMAQDLKAKEVQPWAESRFRQRMDQFAKEDPACFLPSGPRYYIAGMPKLAQTPGVLIVLNDDLTFRQIFLDGRSLPADPNPTFMGYSTGRWDGDTLVVESTGFDERTLLDTGGHPHTEHLRVTERFHRIDLGHMDLQVTFDDPTVYARPLVVPVTMQLVPDDELIEFVCRENEKDYTHIAGKVSDERCDVSAETLRKYVGAYEVRLPSGTFVTINVALEHGELVLDRTPWIPGKMREPLIPVSDTEFLGYFGRRLRFVVNDRNLVEALLFESPEPPLPNLSAVRQTPAPSESTSSIR